MLVACPKTLSWALLLLAFSSPASSAKDSGLSAPEWCGDAKKSYKYSTSKLEKLWNQDPYSLETIVYLARTWCARATSAETVQKASKIRADWMQAMEMSEADMADITGLIPDSASLKDEPFDTRDVKLEGLNPAEQVAYAQNRGLAKMTGGAPFLDVAWMMDGMPGEPSELLRSYFVSRCIEAHGQENRDPIKRMSVWALCSNDARQLDRKKIEKELQALTLEPSARFKLRVMAARAIRHANDMEGEYQELAKSDPGVNKLVYEIPKAAVASWQKTRKAAADIIDLRVAIEDAYRSGSRSALASCTDQLWPHWKKHVAKTKVGLDESIAEELVRAPAGYNLALAMLVCHKERKGSEQIARFLSDALRYSMPVYGERMAVFSDLALAVDKIPFDKRSWKFSADKLPRWASSELDGMLLGRSTGSSLVEGVVDSVKREGDAVVIAFKSSTFMATVCEARVETDKIDRIENGKIIYRKRCAKTRKEKRTTGPSPVIIPKLMDTGIKKGRFARFVSWTSAPPSSALPLEVFKDKKQRKRLAYLGVGK